MTEPVNRRRLRGQTNHLAGLAAEDIVRTRYERSGRAHLASRWRGRAGEIDLIFREGDTVVFVEVKKSDSHAAALASLGRRQIERLCSAVAEFVDGLPLGQRTDVRLDLATVDRNGAVNVLKNALA